jgi:hypothetical protein
MVLGGLGGSGQARRGLEGALEAVATSPEGIRGENAMIIEFTEPFRPVSGNR